MEIVGGLLEIVPAIGVQLNYRLKPEATSPQNFHVDAAFGRKSTGGVGH